MRILALDVGERRIGVALSDPTGVLASPLAVVESVGPRRDVQLVAELAREHLVERILIGLPVSMDGARHGQARMVEAFCDRLTQAVAVPVVLWDERLTTVEADRRMREAGTPARKRKQQRDAVAAAILLQSYLEHLRYVGQKDDPP